MDHVGDDNIPAGDTLSGKTTSDANEEDPRWFRPLKDQSCRRCGFLLAFTRLTAEDRELANRTNLRWKWHFVHVYRVGNLIEHAEPLDRGGGDYSDICFPNPQATSPKTPFLMDQVFLRYAGPHLAVLRREACLLIGAVRQFPEHARGS